MYTEAVNLIIKIIKMSTRNTFRLIAGILQPLIWWGIYILLKPIALKHDAEFGLSLVCSFSCVACFFALIIPVIDKESKI